MNFDVNFNVFLNKYIVHPMVKIKKDLDNIKMEVTTKKNSRRFFEKCAVQSEFCQLTQHLL